ncbi:MAG: hypothetical protein KGP28_04880 [Bdellovibrionales bacterium]|nr:hypothetical protein [Bdellovibrionales bacterium]
MRFLVLMIFFFASPANAYLPPAGFVLGHAVTDRAGLKSLEWTAKVTDLKNRAAFKEVLRLDFISGKISASYQSPTDEALGGIQGPISLLNKLGRFWLCVSLDPNIARVKAALETLRVLPGETEETRLERVGNQIAWMWGVDALIGFEKDEFTPLIYRENADPKADAIIFQGFAIAAANSKVPRNVLVRVKDEDLFSFELKSIKTDSPAIKEKISIAAPQLPSVKEWISLVR